MIELGDGVGNDLCAIAALVLIPLLLADEPLQIAEHDRLRHCRAEIEFIDRVAVLVPTLTGQFGIFAEGLLGTLAHEIGASFPDHLELRQIGLGEPLDLRILGVESVLLGLRQVGASVVI